MNRPSFFILGCFDKSSRLGREAQPQQSPHVGYVFPAGGRQGSEFEVRVGGQFLDGITNAYVSGPGIHVKVVELVKPMTQQQVNQLREQLKALTERLPGAVAAPGKATGTPAGRQGEQPASKPTALPRTLPRCRPTKSSCFSTSARSWQNSSTGLPIQPLPK